VGRTVTTCNPVSIMEENGPKTTIRKIDLQLGTHRNKNVIFIRFEKDQKLISPKTVWTFSLSVHTILKKVHTISLPVHTFPEKVQTILFPVHTFPEKVHTIFLPVQTFLKKVHTILKKVHTILGKVHTILRKVHTKNQT
jgi:hypothetical protein